MKLKNKVAFITGGTSGIGLETARLFLWEGARWPSSDPTGNELEAAGEELGDGALIVHADLRKVAEIERAVEETRAAYGHINIVFANAGASRVAPLESITPEYVEENLALNFTGTLFTIQKTAPLIPTGGSIVVTTSFLNATGTPGLSVHRCEQGRGSIARANAQRRARAARHTCERGKPGCHLHAVLRKDRAG